MLWFQQNHLAATFKIAKQALFITHAQALLLFYHGAGRFQRFIIAALLIASAQLVIQAATLATQFLDGCLGFFFKADFTTIDMVKAARDFTGKFNMWNLVFTYRHLCGLVDQDVRALQQGIAKETVSG